MDSKERLHSILNALASSRRGVLTLNSLMRKSRYKRLENFRRDLAQLEKEGLVTLQRSGFPSDSHMHRKIAVLRANVIWVHPQDKEDLPVEDTRIAISFACPPSKGGLDKIPTLSYNLRRLIAYFFKLCINHRFSKAKEIQDLIKRNLPKQEFFKGFFMAMNGIILGLEEKNPALFVNKIEPKKIGSYIYEFKERRTPLNAEYDQGYFYAMTLYLRHVRKGSE